MNDPADPCESDAITRLDRCKDRLPDLLLAFEQGLIRLGAIAKRIRLAILHESGDSVRRIIRNHIERIIGKIAQLEQTSVDLFALRIPFFGERQRKLLRGHDLRCPFDRFDPATIQSDLPAALCLLRADFSIEALHSLGSDPASLRQREARNLGA